jgi:hypothetical protein
MSSTLILKLNLSHLNPCVVPTKVDLLSRALR